VPVADFGRRCPVWVKSAALTACRSLPVFSHQRTLSGSVGMSQTCSHKQTSRDEIDYPGRASMLGCHSGLCGRDQEFRRTSNLLT
jgi:hypothetical protein